MPIIRDFNKDLVPMDNPIEARKNDLIRITEWLNSPAGTKFAGKQALLRTTGNLESFSPIDIATAAGRGVTDAASAIATILAQIPLNGTGTHFLFNELSSLAFQNSSFYTNNRFASMQANYTGTINIGKSKKVRGTKTWDERGFAPTGGSDDIGITGILGLSAVEEQVVKDTLPVVFSIVGDRNSFLIFRGFVTGLTNTFNANWNAVNYVGRGESMYTYSNSTRGISFKLQIPMFSEQEQEACYKKVNSLISHIFPKYTVTDNDSSLPQGTLTRLRIGDYFNHYCVINSIVDTVDINVPWSAGSANLMLPQVVNLQINAQVIHRNLPTRYLGTSDSNILPYIGTNPANTSENE